MAQARTLKDKELKQLLVFISYRKHALRNRVMLLMTHLAGMLGNSVKLVPSLWHSYRGALDLLEVSDTMDEASKSTITQFLAHHPPGN